MGITIVKKESNVSLTEHEVLLTGGEYSTLDLYNYAVSHAPEVISKLEDTFVIDAKVTLINSAAWRDTNVNIIIKGSRLSPKDGCTVQFGTRLESGQTIDGCTLTMPAVDFKYGLGSVTVASNGSTTFHTGNILFYASKIYAYCFWGFFEGSNHVELIDCKINGLGRISGPDSILLNSEIVIGHGRYGGFTTKGDIKLNSGMSVRKTGEYKHSSTTPTDKAVIYYNPRYAGELVVRNGIYEGYDQLAFVENTSGGESITCIDSDIRGDYVITREIENNVAKNCEFYHKFTFSPFIVNKYNTKLANVHVVITDKTNVVVYDDYTNNTGKIDTELTYYKQNRDGTIETYPNPYTVKVKLGETETTLQFNVNRPMKDFPLYLIANTSTGGGGGAEAVDYDRIQAMIQEASETNCECISDKLNIVENKVSTVLIALTDDIAEGQTILKGTGDVYVVS